MSTAENLLQSILASLVKLQNAQLQPEDAPALAEADGILWGLAEEVTERAERALARQVAPVDSSQPNGGS